MKKIYRRLAGAVYFGQEKKFSDKSELMKYFTDCNKFSGRESSITISFLSNFNQQFLLSSYYSIPCDMEAFHEPVSLR